MRFLQAVFERKKNDTCPAVSAIGFHNFEEMDFLNNYVII